MSILVVTMMNNCARDRVDEVDTNRCLYDTFVRRKKRVGR